MLLKLNCSLNIRQLKNGLKLEVNKKGPWKKNLQNKATCEFEGDELIAPCTCVTAL